MIEQSWPLSPPPSESEEQQVVIEWAEYTQGHWPELALLYHVPNGGKRGKVEAARFKREGVKPGVPDLCLPVARNGRHGLYIEMKAMDGKLTAKQSEWLEALKKQGYLAVECHGAAAAIRFLEWYLKGKPWASQ